MTVTKKTEAKETEAKNSSIIFGVVSFLGNGTTIFDKEAKNRITLKECKINYNDFDTVFKGNKFVPDWYSYRENTNVNLKSNYDIPIMMPDGNIVSFDDFDKRNDKRGSKVAVKVKITDKAIYPSAIKVFELGEEYNLFEDFDNGEELPFN